MKDKEYHNPNNNWYKGSKMPKMILSSKICLCLFIAAFILLFALLFTGCKSIQYVPVETVKTEYISKTDTVNRIDTLISEKETIIREADSSLVAKLGLQLKDNEKAILILQRELERQVNKESEHSTDTLIKTDSIQVPYPVERKLSKWEEVKMDMGGMAIGGCFLLIIIIVGYWIFKVRR